MYIVVPTTNGAASCPRSVPVENDQESLSCLMFSAVFVERAESGAGEVLARTNPLAILGGARVRTRGRRR